MQCINIHRYIHIYLFTCLKIANAFKDRNYFWGNRPLSALPSSLLKVIGISILKILRQFIYNKIFRFKRDFLNRCCVKPDLQ